MTTETVIRAAVEAYDRGDAETLTAHLSDQMCYTINSCAELGPYHADCHCKAEFFDAVAKIQADWIIESYKIIDLIINGDRGAAQIALSITSRHTGQKRQTRLALFMTVENGLITAIHEYHDTAQAATARGA